MTKPRKISMMKTPKTKHPVRVLAAPPTHWGVSRTTAWAQLHPKCKSIDVVVHDPACLTTARTEEMARHEGTTVVLRLTRRQLSAWLEQIR